MRSLGLAAVLAIPHAGPRSRLRVSEKARGKIASRNSKENLTWQARKASRLMQLKTHLPPHPTQRR